MCDAERFLRNKKEFYRKKKKCGNPDVQVIIVEKGRRYQICRKCWDKIERSNLEW